MKIPWKKLALALGVLAVVGVGLWEALPALARREIHKRHPEVAFERLDLAWTEVTLHNVNIDKGWIVAHVTRARVNVRTESVSLMGGTVDVNLDKRPSGSHGGGLPKAKITADGLTVNVRGCDVSAVVEGFAVHDGYTATRATVVYKGQRVNAAVLSAQADLSSVRAGAVTFPEGLRIKGEYVHPTVEGLVVDPRDKSATFASVEGAYFFGQEQRAHAMSGPGRVRMGDSGLVTIDLDQVRVEHPWLLRDSGATFRRISAEVPLAGEAFDLHIGGAKVHLDPRDMSISGDERCETWVSAMPEEFRVGPLKDTEFRKGALQFSLGLKPQPHFKISGQCATSCASVGDLRHRFTYRAYGPKGEPIQRTSGPWAPEWASIEGIHENMITAVLNMEDLGFRFHHGFLPAALQNSFAIDVRAGRFERGGSTITMQTAKNLWLSREKTVGRKLEELLLSQVLESCLSKDEILALYLNIVEFGPNLYGIRQATHHYFKTEPSALEPTAAFYLAWILPRPRTAPPPDAPTLERVKRIMKALAAQNKIPETMLTDETASTEGWEAAP